MKATSTRPGTRQEGNQKLGSSSLKFGQPPLVRSGYGVASKKEARGPLGDGIHETFEDDQLGQSSWEGAARQILKRAVRGAVDEAGFALEDMDFLLAGDLLNQITTSNFAALEMDRPYFGLFSACATFAEGLILGSTLLSGGFARQLVVATASHNKTAERQFRYPTELASYKPVTAQWTVTGGGGAVLASAASTGGAAEGEPRITMATVGRVHDFGVADAFNMGTAMAPAAADTLERHFRDTGRSPGDYDRIVTGDLASVGSPILLELMQKRGYDLSNLHEDCGARMFHRQKQKVNAGASGAGCCSLAFAADYLPQLVSGEIERLLFVCTGCLHSTTSTKQGDNIPVIAHAVSLEAK